jgi:ribosomal protein S18 acetylase RimI-like enzyme
MTSTLIVRQFKTTEWQAYKDLRLNALKESPEAFGSIYEDAVKNEDINWKNRLAQTSAKNDYPMVALVGDEFAGLGWVMVEPPENDVAHLYQMWVDPRFRRLGLGRALVESGINWTRSRGTKSMLLEVTCGDRPARRLYDSLGFVSKGDPVPMRSDSDCLQQLMELRLRIDKDE